MRILVLEDNPERIKRFRDELRFTKAYVAVNARHAIGLLGDFRFDVVFLDHDLGGEENVESDSKNTGAEVCRWVSMHPGNCADTRFIIHSLNPVGAMEMERLLRDAGLKVVRIPFLTLDIAGLARP